MKALVLDGSHEGDSLTSVAVLGMTSALAGRGISVELVKPRELAIAPCEGMPSKGGKAREIFCPAHAAFPSFVASGTS
jgi:hypothetical protein